MYEFEQLKAAFKNMKPWILQLDSQENKTLRTKYRKQLNIWVLWADINEFKILGSTTSNNIQEKERHETKTQKA